MKKILSVVCSLCLLLALCAFPTMAAELPITESHGVQGQFLNRATTPKVYSVAIEWGEMEFTYTKTGTMDWDADSHSYQDNTVGTWTAKGNEVTVRNHSNAPVKASLRLELNSGIQGSFDKTELNLATAEGTTRDTAPAATAKLTITGGAVESSTLTQIGTITVSVTGE